MNLQKNVLAKQGLSKKIIIGFAALVSAVLVGTVGMAGAHQKDNQPPESFCKQSRHFKNHGQCVKDWKHKRKHGYGYDGGHKHGRHDHKKHHHRHDRGDHHKKKNHGFFKFFSWDWWNR